MVVFKSHNFKLPLLPEKNNFYINLLCEAQKRAPPGCRQILSPGLKWARLPVQAPSVCIWPCLSGPQSPNPCGCKSSSW